MEWMELLVREKFGFEERRRDTQRDVGCFAYRSLSLFFFNTTRRMRVSPSDKSLIRLRISSHWENMRAGGCARGGLRQSEHVPLASSKRRLGGDHGRHLQGQGEGVRARERACGGEGRKECVSGRDTYRASQRGCVRHYPFTNSSPLRVNGP